MSTATVQPINGVLIYNHTQKPIELIENILHSLQCISHNTTGQHTHTLPIHNKYFDCLIEFNIISSTDLHNVSYATYTYAGLIYILDTNSNINAISSNIHQINMESPECSILLGIDCNDSQHSTLQSIAIDHSMQYISLISQHINTTIINHTGSNTKIWDNKTDNGIIELNYALQNTLWPNITRHDSITTQQSTLPKNNNIDITHQSEYTNSDDDKLDDELDAMDQLMNEMKQLRNDSQSGTLSDTQRKQQAEQLIMKMMQQFGIDHDTDTSDADT